jgi:hypothetical protein
MTDEPVEIGLEEASSQHLGVRVWSVQATSQQMLIDRVAVVLGEHMDDADDMHITYAVVQNGSQERVRPRVLREPDVWTELYFEYSALIVLRSPGVSSLERED